MSEYRERTVGTPTEPNFNFIGRSQFNALKTLMRRGSFPSREWPLEWKTKILMDRLVDRGLAKVETTKEGETFFPAIRNIPREEQERWQ